MSRRLLILAVLMILALASCMTLPPPPSPAPLPPPQAPEFPWPPPQASASYVMPNNLLVDPGFSLRFGDVDARLCAALDKCGYATKSYFAVPGGFALVTRLEQIEPDGTPKGVPDRWCADVGPLHRFSFSAYLSALFTANPGHFRIISFIVTATPFSQPDATITRKEAIEWLSAGLNRLPPSIAALPYGDSVCTALIYEFVKVEGQEADTVIPGRIEGNVHLAKAAILDNLRR